MAAGEHALEPKRAALPPLSTTIPLAAKRLGGGEADVRAPPCLEKTHVVLQAALMVFVFGMGALGAARYPK